MSPEAPAKKPALLALGWDDLTDLSIAEMQPWAADEEEFARLPSIYNEMARMATAYADVFPGRAVAILIRHNAEARQQLLRDLTTQLPVRLTGVTIDRCCRCERFTMHGRICKVCNVRKARGER